MTCYYPRILRNGHEQFKVPCGDCIGCRLEYSRQWALRCTHEAQLYNDNCFVTLTYNDENLPWDMSVNKRDLQLFMKRLRKSQGKGIRFYACGEYGSNKDWPDGIYPVEGLGRPHYHACIFNYLPKDKVPLEEITHRPSTLTKGEFDLFYSRELERIWGKGFVTVGDVSFKSAGYVARYTAKKIRGRKDKVEEHYQGLEPEFALMSRRPGIGRPWFDKYMSDCYPKDFVTCDGIKQKLPKFYDRAYMRYLADNDEEYGTFEDWEAIKLKRKEAVKNEDSVRGWQRAQHRKLITKPLIRRIENET
jgi:hypothetical protein